jgi:hypothetical protein
MKKNLQVKVEIYEQGFATKTFRHQSIFPFDRYFTKPVLIDACRFVKQCLDSYNKGARGLQYGRGERKENDKVEKN